ncbi:MAG: DoxX family protein [Polyangiaceae bacterium]|nr:DoxX family protein [Polyangiaceae bacterium]
MTALQATIDSSVSASESPASTTAERSRGGSRRGVWAGRIISGIAVLFLTMDATLKLLQVPEAMEGTQTLGWPVEVVFWLGLLQVACLALYLIPRTAPLGAVLWTGYLGGAIATHLRVLNPIFSHTLFPIYVAVFLWGGLYLRDARVRALIAPRSATT